MKEAKGNLWDFPADARVITTNGYVNKYGCAVMGRGCAYQAKERYPGLDRALGVSLIATGNHVYVYLMKDYIITMPVKFAWYERADLDLIQRSTKELVEVIDAMKFENIVLPRPGCGNGGRDWETEVKPIIEPLLDERFTVITYA